MQFLDCLVCPDLFCVACLISEDEILADIVWSRNAPQGKQCDLVIPKKIDSPIYQVIVPEDLEDLHTDVRLKRVCTALEDHH